MSLSNHKLAVSGLANPSDPPFEKRSRHGSVDVKAAVPPGPRRKSSNPLLNISIVKRLALGFLIPALLAAITLSSVGIQSQQRLLQESTFYKNLLDAYTSLSTATVSLQVMQSDLLDTVTYAAQLHPAKAILSDDQAEVQGLAMHFNTILGTYLQQDLLKQYPDLSALFTEAGYGGQIEQQQTYSQGVLRSWLAYSNIQGQALRLIIAGNPVQAQTLMITQENAAFSDALRDLQALIKFNGSLGPSLQDATNLEVQKLFDSTILAVLSVLLGIGLVGWLISSTLVQRLQRLRAVVQAIANGKVDARLDARGRDEIADVSAATNTMVDTLVGLLEETKRQRDELADAQQLQRLHEQLQREHEALNEANTRLAALATTDPLTGLSNHRAVMGRIEEELSRCRRTQGGCAILFVDLDHFKHINDTWGHQAGDAILHEAGRRLMSTLRREDFVGRYGGEEFAIVLTNMTLGAAKETAERLRSALAETPCEWQAEDTQSVISIPVTASIGVAVYDEDGDTREALIEAADNAMYCAKRSGRNRVCLAGEKLALVQQMLATAQQGNDGTLQALSAVASMHDEGTSTHAQRMVQLAQDTARQLGRSDEEIHLIRLAALLHDIGKVGIPDAILHKPGPLTEEEWTVMHRHPNIGRQILAKAGGQFELLSHIVVAHHERWDGGGYPYGLTGEAIPLGARILSAVDSYDAMTSTRPYRAALSDEYARSELERGAGNQFDPQVVNAFLLVLDAQGQRELVYLP